MPPAPSADHPPGPARRALTDTAGTVTTMDQTTTAPPTPIPAGDVTWDGTTLTVGGTPLTPGRWQPEGTNYVIEVYPDGDPDEDDTEE